MAFMPCFTSDKSAQASLQNAAGEWTHKPILDDPSLYEFGQAYTTPSALEGTGLDSMKRDGIRQHPTKRPTGGQHRSFPYRSVHSSTPHSALEGTR